MRSDRGRTKKLILAFHFLFSSQAAWKCEHCRAGGLEKKRNCGHLGDASPEAGRVVWARKGIVVTRCPKSEISAESLGWLEEYCAWKLAGGADFRTLNARQVEAFWVLEKELADVRSSDG